MAVGVAHWQDDDGVHDLVGEGLALGPGGRERIALQLRVLDNGGNPRRTNEVVMSGHHAAHHQRISEEGRPRAGSATCCGRDWAGNHHR